MTTLNMLRRKTLFVAIPFALALLVASVVSADYSINAPDGRLIHLKEGTFQPDLSPYRSKLPEVKILDRTFKPKYQQWAANEEFEISQTGLNNMVRAALPLEHNAAFIWMTNQQIYWNARNNLGFGFAASHSGINMVNGPYFTMKALELSSYNRLERDRGERILSNKDAMLQWYFPLVWKRIGIPRFPDDGQPAYLEFEAGDPHFVAPTPVTDTFDDPQSGKNGKWGVPEYFFNNRQWRWDRDKMVKYIDMGGIGIMLKRASMWVDYMWKATHTGQSPSNQTKRIVLAGNDAEEGFRGMALATSRANQVLSLKAQLVANESGDLGGINPATYDPKNGLRYFPHRIWPNMLLAGDLPERQWGFEIDDPRSLLFDQAALLWGNTHFFQSTYRMTEMFTDNPPVDGGILEKSLGVVPHHLANMILKNIVAMHTKDGVLVSTWEPKNTDWWIDNKYNKNPGSSNEVEITDMGLTLIALKEYVDRMRDPQALIATPDKDDLEPELTKVATDLLVKNADFLLKIQGANGEFCESYNVETSQATGPCDLSRPNFTGVFALLEAHKLTGESKYVEAARQTWNYVWANFWHEPTGLFRSRLGDDTVRIHSLDIAAQLRAWREMMFATPIHLTKPLITNFSRWSVQTLMMTGMIQSEENRSGELAMGVGSRDWDNDGVPWLGKGDGKFGIAPTLALEVAVNIAEPGKNKAFNNLDGQKHWAEMYGGKIRYAYNPMSQDDAVKRMQLPVKIDYEAMVDDEEWVERDELLRWDGTVQALPPAKKFKRGSTLTGRQIFEMNCAHCHGYTGEGITGISYEADSLVRTRNDMFEVPHNGRFTRLMPEWGLGNRDEMESVLTDEEIYKIVDYIQSDKFKKIFVDVQNGYAFPQFPPKDPYFFISRSYIRGKKNPATREDIALIMNLQRDVSKTGKPINIIEKLIEAENAGGAKGQVAIATEWPDDQFRKVLSYDNETQVLYAQKPVELVDETAIATAKQERAPEDKEEEGVGQQLQHHSKAVIRLNDGVEVALGNTAN
jgi:mono/diheme cytochrome c family protein